MFKKATRTQKKLRLALLGPAGAGKTRTALEIAKGLGKKIALIDTEHGSATMFAHLVDFETVELMSFAPERYIEAMDAADEGGFDVLVIDSLSHAWSGKGGILEFVDRTKKNGNSFNAWGDATPMQNKLVERLLTCKQHLIVTMRTKMEFIQEKDPQTGKTAIRKVGLQPVQRDGVEYEFDVVADIDQNHTLTVAKTRIDEIEGEIIEKAGSIFGARLAKWLASGAPPVPVPNESELRASIGHELDRCGLEGASESIRKRALAQHAGGIPRTVADMQRAVTLLKGFADEAFVGMLGEGGAESSAGPTGTATTTTSQTTSAQTGSRPPLTKPTSTQTAGSADAKAAE